MLHTRVWCRARAWDVIDVRREDDVTMWRLRHDHDPPRLLASPPDDVQPLRETPRRVSPHAWARAMVSHLRGAMPSWWPSTLLRLPLERLPWQAVPAMLVLSGRHRRLLVADPVGTGKTVQAALLLRELHDRDPDASSLVIVPAGLLAQWSRELRDRVGLEATVLDAPRLRGEALRPVRLVDEARRGACWLVSIDLVRQPDVTSLFTRTPWTLLVVDEAHAAAPATARLDAVRAIADASARVVLLTGTPTAVGPAGLEALRDIGTRHGERPMRVLRREPASRRPDRRSRVVHVRLDRAHAALCARLDAFAARARAERGGAGLLPALVLRRRAASCPGALARSVERRLLVLGETSDREIGAQPTLFDDIDQQDDDLLHRPAWRNGEAERQELQTLLAEARRLSPHGRKIAAVARYVRRCRQPAIVFTAYVDTARLVRDALEGLRLAVVHGRLPDAMRAHAIEAFTAGDTDVLITTDASAEGLNLHARCRLVIHADLPVSPRVLAQRTGRVDRLGQQRRVHEVLLSSLATDDVEMLARLMAAGRDEALLDDERVRHGPHMRLAQTLLTRGAATPSRVGTRVPSIVTCVVSPAAWHRRRTRWHLPATTTALQVCELTVCGATALARSEATAALITAGSSEPSAAMVARAVRGLARRACARVARLDTWQRDAEQVARRCRDRMAPADLFVAADTEATPASPISTGPAFTVRVYGRIGMRRRQAGTP